MDEHMQTTGDFLDGRHAKAAARIAALEAELAERTRELEECRKSAFDRTARCAVQRDTIDILTRDLAAERERREAAEAVLQDIYDSLAVDNWPRPLIREHLDCYKD